MLSESASYNFIRAWYDNALSCDEADPVVVTAGFDTKGIDFQADAYTDTDNDNMPDQWEINYFGNITSREGSRDVDSDGVTDLGEYMAGTAPGEITQELDIDNGGDDGGSCFIATADYNSPMKRHVKHLRDFSDRFLLTGSIGKAFKKLYYNYSHHIAKIRAENDSIYFAARWSLTPIVGLSWALLNFGSLTAFILLFFISSGLIRFSWFKKKI